MSNMPDNNLDLELQFLPAWAQQSSTVNPFADFEGDAQGGPERRRFDRDDRRRRPPRRGPGEGPGPGGRPSGERGAQPRPPQSGRFSRPGGGSRPREENREPLPPLPEIQMSLLPEPKGVEALARHIRMTGRAYPLFDIGHFIMKRPDRFHAQFGVIKKADGQIAQPLFLCSLDESLWLSDAEAVDHVLAKHFGTFYQAEKIGAEPPKGVFTFVAQCGMSGAILGPPNYHGYQNKLHKLHAERFAHMPFEVYKARVRIVRDEAVVKKWVEDQSFTTQYVCLNVADSLKLGTREEVERHFREVHLANVIQPVDNFTMTGQAARSQPCHTLQMLYRRSFEEQRRFPIKVVTVLSQMFASHGLQFFKVNKSITHVAVSRPHFLDVSTAPVSEDIKKIIAFINSHPGCNRRQLVEVLAPLPGTTETAAPIIPSEIATDTTPATPATPPPAATPAPPIEVQPATPEMAATISNLHWLIHQGHVIEFANGVLETAKLPLPKPPRPERPKAPPAAPAPSSAPSTPATAESAAAAAESASTMESPLDLTTEMPAESALAAETPVESTPTDTAVPPQPPTEASPAVGA